MGAEDEAGRKPRGILGRVAAAGLGHRDRAPEGSAADDRPVSFLLDTNLVSEWVSPNPDQAWLPCPPHPHRAPLSLTRSHPPELPPAPHNSPPEHNGHTPDRSSHAD